MFENIFRPIKINSLTVKNRLLVPPMVTNFADKENFATKQSNAYYTARAKGGFGLIVVEALAVHLLGRSYHYGLGLWDDKFIDNLKIMTDESHAYDAKIFAQLIHGGAQTKPDIIGTQTVAPSALLHPGYNVLPREMSKDEILEMIDSFGQAALRAKKAGFDGVEVHGSHGYLVSEFMSQVTNKRTDEYGGSLLGRLTVPIEILKSIRNYCGNDYPVTIRIAGDERLSDGRKIEETKVAIKILDEAGYDAFHVTTANTASTGYVAPPSYVEIALNVNFAEKIKKITKKPIITTGRIHDANLAEMILAEERADIVGIGRSSIADPEFVNKVQKGDLEDIKPCVACLQGCIHHLYTDQPITCLANPLVGHESTFEIEQAKDKKKILIAGGGPAGLEVARILALRGHNVHLYDKAEKLGGQLLIACMPPHKQALANLVKYMVKDLERSGVKVHLETQVNKKLVEEMQPDLVINASGGKAILPNLPGQEHVNAVSAWDLLMGKVTVGVNVLIVGGGSVGLETADFLAEQGKKVTLVEMKDEIGADMVKRVRQFLTKRLDELKTNINVSCKVCEFCSGGAIVDSNGQTKTFDGYDNIVWALGTRPDDTLEKELADCQVKVIKIGDAAKVKDALAALEEARELAVKL